MRKCAYLSMDDLSDFVSYDELTFKPMAERGWQVEEVSWRASEVDWNDFEAIVIRTPWDYQNAPDAFIKVLEQIDQSKARLLNSLATVNWNISKTYLRDLERRGVPIVPTIWQDSYKDAVMHAAYDNWGAPEIIIKPQVSANADDTFRLSPLNLAQQSGQLAKLFDQRPHMIQPFMPEIITEGEFSLFYFAGNYSHAISKKPKSKDFRVQEEHGGKLAAITPEDALRQAGDKVMAAVPEQLLYARVDLVRHGKDYYLMELEAIEPSLYFNMDKRSADKFAAAFVTLMQKREGM